MDATPTILAGDCLERLAELDAESIDAIVTDPPYGLGFMGKAWDALPPGEEWARECLRVLKPGGHLLAFGGTRTWHRLAVAVEDAGFEMRDSIAWLYGSGFPKSLDVSKAIDKRGGDPHLAGQIGAALKAARESRGISRKRADAMFCNGTSNYSWFEGRPAGQRPPTPETFARIVQEWPELAAYADMVAEAELEITGERTSTNWKPAGRGTARTITKQRRDKPATPESEQWQGWGTALKPAFEPVVVARKPLDGTVAANVLAHGTGALNIDACRIGSDGGGTHCGNRDDSGKCLGHGNAGRSTSGETFHGPESAGGRWPANVALDDTTAAILDEQSGTTTSKAAPRGGTSPAPMSWGEPRADGDKIAGHDDSGGASRFFYVAKAPKRERPNVDGVQHPTVKPLTLMRWLVRLVTPPGGTVLDPFAGSGTTIEAALLEGFDVIGIEREAQYLPLITERIERATRALA